jgi:hypothetical protein
MWQLTSRNTKFLKYFDQDFSGMYTLLVSESVESVVLEYQIFLYIFKRELMINPSLHRPQVRWPRLRELWRRRRKKRRWNMRCGLATDCWFLGILGTTLIFTWNSVKLETQHCSHWKTALQISKLLASHGVIYADPGKGVSCPAGEEEEVGAWPLLAAGIHVPCVIYVAEMYLMWLKPVMSALLQYRMT